MRFDLSIDIYCYLINWKQICFFFSLNSILPDLWSIYLINYYNLVSFRLVHSLIKSNSGQSIHILLTTAQVDQRKKLKMGNFKTLVMRSPNFPPIHLQIRRINVFQF